MSNKSQPPPLCSRDVYQQTLDNALTCLEEHEGFDEYILSTISEGCWPLVDYAVEHGVRRIILQSPSALRVPSGIQRNSLRAYFWKAFYPQTWTKLFLLRLDVAAIARNLWSRRHVASAPDVSSETRCQHPQGVQVLCLFGSRDMACRQASQDLRELARRVGVLEITEAVVPDADHSFFGWQLKIQVCQVIQTWLTEGRVKAIESTKSEHA